MKKIFLFTLVLFSSIISFIFLTPLVSAHCPLCTGAAIAGISFARLFGVDDSIVGLFLGAFIVSTALWFNKWLMKKKIKIPMQETLLIIISFLLLAVPFYSAGVITDFDMVKSMPEHHAMLGMGIYGIDKLSFGMIVGTLFIWGAFRFSDYIKKKRGKRLYPFQGFSFMLISLVVLSLIFWRITR